MARYLFHLHGGDRAIEDYEGSDLPDSKAAHGEAFQSIQAILEHVAFLGGEPPGRVIDVTDEWGHPIDTVRCVDLPERNDAFQACARMCFALFP